METATIRFSMPNIITITLCALLGYFVFVGLMKAWSTVQAKQGS